MNLQQVTETLRTLNELANTVARIRIDMMTPEQKHIEMNTIHEAARNRFAWEDHRDGLDTSKPLPHSTEILPSYSTKHVAVLGGHNGEL